MNISLVMQSCKKFSSICKTTIESLNQYKFINKIYIATDDDSIKFNSDKKVKLTFLSKDLGFSSNMLEALKSAEDDIVLVLLDDYVMPAYADQPVDQQELISRAFKLLNDNRDVACVRFNIFDKKCADFSDNILNFVRVKNDFKYLCSLQPALWRKSHLLSILKSGEDAWDVELKGSKRMRKLNLKAYISQSEQMIHINALRFGKYMRDKFVDHAGAKGIEIPNNMDVFVKEKKTNDTTEKKIMNLKSYLSSKRSR